MSGARKREGADVNTPALPFVAKYGLGWQIGLSMCWVFLLAVYLLMRGNDGQLSIFQMWGQAGLLIRSGIVIGAVVIVFLPFEVFRQRFVFLEDRILHRPTVGREQAFRYGEIQECEMYPGEFVRLSFRDGRRLTVWAAQADPRMVEQIVRARSGTAEGEIRRKKEDKKF